MTRGIAPRRSSRRIRRRAGADAQRRGDGKGNVFVIWRKRGTGSAIFDLFARRYTPGTTWGPEMKIDAIDLIGGAAASVMSPVLGMNGSGVAVAAWYYDIASPDVYANVTR